MFILLISKGTYPWYVFSRKAYQVVHLSFPLCAWCPLVRWSAVRSSLCCPVCPFSCPLFSVLSCLSVDQLSSLLSVVLFVRWSAVLSSQCCPVCSVIYFFLTFVVWHPIKSLCSFVTSLFRPSPDVLVKERLWWVKGRKLYNPQSSVGSLRNLYSVQGN